MANLTFKIASIKDWVNFKNKVDTRLRKSTEPFVISIQQGKKRSNPQNAYLWGVVYTKIVKHLKDKKVLSIKGKDITTEQVHGMCKKAFIDNYDVWTFKGLYHEEQVSTKDMSTIEFENYIGEIRDYFANNGLDIPPPNEPSLEELQQQEN